MFNNDYIMREIENATNLLTQAVFNKETKRNQFVDEYGNYTEEKFLLHKLKQLLYDGDLNKAEDLLFQMIEEHPKSEYLSIANEFYNELSKMSDKYLVENNFSREEIAQGIEDIKKFY